MQAFSTEYYTEGGVSTHRMLINNHNRELFLFEPTKKAVLRVLPKIILKDFIWQSP